MTPGTRRAASGLCSTFQQHTHRGLMCVRVHMRMQLILKGFRDIIKDKWTGGWEREAVVYFRGGERELLGAIASQIYGGRKAFPNSPYLLTLIRAQSFASHQIVSSLRILIDWRLTDLGPGRATSINKTVVSRTLSLKILIKFGN